MWVTFAGQFVTKNFQKSPNPITLICSYLSMGILVLAFLSEMQQEHHGDS